MFGQRKSNGNWLHDKLIKCATEAVASRGRVHMQIGERERCISGLMIFGKSLGIGPLRLIDFNCAAFACQRSAMIQRNSIPHLRTTSIWLNGDFGRNRKKKEAEQKEGLSGTYHKRLTWLVPTIVCRQYSRRRTYNWPCPAIALKIRNELMVGRTSRSAKTN